MMHLKKLTLCLLALGLTACSTYDIKNNNLKSGVNASQRAINGFNALYEYPNFDYRGNIKVQLSSTQKDQKTADSDVKKLDPMIEQKVNQYLYEQKISLTNDQKKELYGALAKQDARSLNGILGKGADIVANILNDLQIRYDGTVNYQQKIASFNLETKYKKPNLSVEMRVPTIIDFNQYKFYTHIFSLMPYLANPQDQDKYAYYDFSKYKDDISRVNGKALLEFMKQSGATTYLLAPQNKIENLSVSLAEKQAGVVEKIRLQSTIEELFLQGNLYSSVNRQYFMNSVLGLKPESMAKLLDDSAEKEHAENESDESVPYATKAAMEAEGLIGAEEGDNEASSAMYKLYDAVNKKLNTTAVDDLNKLSASESSEDEESVNTESEETLKSDDNEAESESNESEDSEYASDDAEREKILTEEQCHDLAKVKSKIRFGDVEYCQYSYEIDVLNPESENGESAERTAQKVATAQLAKKFESYAKDQLVNAEQFKQLWDQHQAEVDASLPPLNARTPLIVDLSLDEKGRAVKADYDVGVDLGKEKRKLNLKMDMQISNYGNASKINQQDLKDAKSFKDIFKGSLLENAIGGLTGRSHDVSQENAKAESVHLSLDERLAQLAEQVFTQTGSFGKTYNAVFIAKLTAEKPELIQQYSAQDLQEIAAIYAYSYSSEEAYSLNDQALIHVEAFKKKHHLEDDHQYDDELGNAVNDIVMEVWHTKQSVLEIQALVKKYKNTEAVFSQYYMQKFEAENDIDKSQRAEFVKTAQVLSKAYSAFKKHQFNEKVVDRLTEDSAEFIDYDLFKKSYEAMSHANLK